MKRLVCILSPIIVGITFVFFLNYYLDNKIDNLMRTKDISVIKKNTGNIYKDKGLVFNKYITNNNDLIVQGSSELGSTVDQVITNFFPIAGAEEDITTYGRAHTQYLEHATILASNKLDSNNKVVLINSLQWFFEKKGIDSNNFQSTFSPIQFYQFLENENISEENKVKYVKRVNELLQGSNQFYPEKVYSGLYIEDNLLSKTIKYVLKPYYYLRRQCISLKDKGLLYKELVKSPEKSDEKKEVKEVNWEEENKKAEQQAKELVTNNDFGVLDTYYDQYIRPDIESLKNSQENIDVLDSKEYEDYELYLDVCVDLGVKPYIVLMPTNGKWYDYTGISKSEREAFYCKVEQLASDKGFKVLNLQDEEYTQYFMTDVMHLGWKGWLRVNEEIYENFK